MKLFVTNNISIVDECRHFFNFELPSVSALLSFCTNCTHTVINLFYIQFNQLISVVYVFATIRGELKIANKTANINAKTY